MQRNVAVALLLLAGLFSSGPAGAEVKLGIAGPMTGPNAALGEQLKVGAGQAIEDINAAGGILGQKISSVEGDDAGDPRQGVSVANRFAAEGINFVVGHINSGVSIPASDVYLENGIISITPSSTAPELTDRGLWNVFRTCGRDDQQGAVAGDYILKNFAGKNLAIVHDKTPFGQGVATEVQKAVNKGGLKEVVFEGINVGDKDYSALITRLSQANVDVVYFGGLFTEAGLIIRQMHDQGLKAVLFAGDGIASSEFASIAGPGAEGTLMTFAADPRKDPANKQIVDRFLAKGFDPEAYTLYSYAAVQILAQAAQAAGTLDGQHLAKIIHSGKEFDTVVGKISYDAKGDMKDPGYVIYEWKGNADGKINYAGNQLQ